MTSCDVSSLQSAALLQTLDTAVCHCYTLLQTLGLAGIGFLAYLCVAPPASLSCAFIQLVTAL